MSQRHDYSTNCPICESRMPLTLSAQLQAGRSGTSCVCQSSQCGHEWICIQEWIYRDASAITAVNPNAIVLQPPSASIAPSQMHLPTYQPPIRPRSSRCRLPLPLQTPLNISPCRLHTHGAGNGRPGISMPHNLTTTPSVRERRLSGTPHLFPNSSLGTHFQEAPLPRRRVLCPGGMWG